MISKQLEDLRRRLNTVRSMLEPNEQGQQLESVVTRLQQDIQRHENLIGIYDLAISWNGGAAVGIELASRRGNCVRYCAILEEPDGSGHGRVVYFDEAAMYRHSVFTSPDEALQTALLEGYVEWSRGTMDRLAVTPAWRTCVAQSDLMNRFTGCGDGDTRHNGPSLRCAAGT